MILTFQISSNFLRTEPIVPIVVFAHRKSKLVCGKSKGIQNPVKFQHSILLPQFFFLIVVLAYFISLFGGNVVE